MPEGRLRRTRENNRCPMCGDDALVGVHIRIVGLDGSVRENCPKRFYSLSAARVLEPMMVPTEHSVKVVGLSDAGHQ